MATEGVATRTIQGWCGHASSTTIERYIHFAPSRDRDLMERAYAAATRRRTA